MTSKIKSNQNIVFLWLAFILRLIRKKCSRKKKRTGKAIINKQFFFSEELLQEIFADEGQYNVQFQKISIPPTEGIGILETREKDSCVK